jgi:hypothetical protein
MWEAIYPCDTSSLPASGLAIALNIASEILWAKSGRQFDQCVMTIRPCMKRWNQYGDIAGWYNWTGDWVWPRWYNGVWTNVLCGFCGDSCSCTFVSQFNLPGPVTGVASVKVDGVELPSSAYRVDDWRTLVRLNGEHWPECNDLSKSDSEVGTWSITFVHGQALPELAKLAVGELACEIAKFLAGQACQLPKYVSQLIRQGVTLQFPDASEMFEHGRIGLYWSDLFIATYNQYGLPSRMKVYNVDDPGYRIAGT